MEKIYYITGNEHKLKEAREILPFVEGLKIDLPEIQSLDSHEVIKFKLESAKKVYPDKNLIVDDASVCFDCFNNLLPGPLIKWFLQSLKLDGLINLVKIYGNNRAIVKGLIGLCYENKIEIFEGVVYGRIVEPRGDRTFGWDPIFQPDNYDKTYAEMGSEKNKISHRRLALKKLKEFLNK